MREVDRIMIEDYGITILQMMENAGRNLARLAQKLFLEDTMNNQIVVLAGGGGNGGGALVCGRYLHNWGYDIQVILSKREQDFSGVPLHQMSILKKLGLVIISDGPEVYKQQPALIIDGLIGYSLSGAAKGHTAKLIEWANSCSCPVLSLDLPSGLDATAGFIGEPVIRATATMTLALPKSGLMEKSARYYAGDLYLADIGVPSQLYTRLSLNLKVGNLFRNESVVRIY